MKTEKETVFDLNHQIEKTKNFTIATLVGIHWMVNSTYKT